MMLSDKWSKKKPIWVSLSVFYCCNVCWVCLWGEVLCNWWNIKEGQEKIK